LVTGATGFIGSHLVQALLESAHQVRILARAPSAFRTHPHCQTILGDLTDPRATRTAAQGMDVVYHLAAIRDRWGVPYDDYHTVNVKGTRSLLNAAADEGARFVYCSSVGVLGYPGVLGIDEAFPYGAEDGKYNYHHTKVLAEQLTLDYARSGRLAATIVRPVITYGPGDEYGMVTKLLRMISAGHFIQVGSGRNHVHLAYASDTVRGIILAGESDRSPGQVYILPGTRPIAMNELLAQTCAILGRVTPCWRVPLTPAKGAAWMFESLFTLQRRLGLNVLGDEPFLTRDKIDTLTMNRGFSGQRAERDLGYRPSVDYAEGLTLTVGWARHAGLLS